MTVRVGIFGGSFDPPHAAHVMFAAYALSIGDFDRLLVIPTFAHPLDKELRTGFAHRYRMCELAFGDLRRLEVSRIEEELGDTSYTLDTIEALRARMPDAALRLVIGADILGEIDRWHRFDRIAELAPPMVIGRSGYDTHGWEVMPVTLPAVSSTEIRRRLAAGEDVTGLVPRAVEAYARANGLYGTTAT